MSTPTKKLTASERREKERAENEKKIQNANEILKQIAEAAGIPRNVRREIRSSLDLLNDRTLGLGVRAANAVSSLEELGRNPSISSTYRVAVWSAISILESVRDTG